MKGTEEAKSKEQRDNELQANRKAIETLKANVGKQPVVGLGENTEYSVRMTREDITKMARSSKKAVEADVDLLAKEAKEIDTEIKSLNATLKTIDQYIGIESSVTVVDPVKIKFLQEQAEKFDKRRKEAEEKATTLQNKLKDDSPEMDKIKKAHERRLERVSKLSEAAEKDIPDQIANLESAKTLKKTLDLEMQAVQKEKAAIDKELKERLEASKKPPENKAIESEAKELEGKSKALQVQVDELKTQISDVKGVMKQAKKNIDLDKQDIKFNKEEEKSVKRQNERLEKASKTASESVNTAKETKTLETKQEGQAFTRKERIGALKIQGQDQVDKEQSKGFFEKLKDNFNTHRYQKDIRGEVHDTFTPAKKNPVKFLGNMVNGAMNGVGALAKTGSEYVGKGAAAIGDLSGKPLDAARKNFHDAKGAAKVGWGFAVAGAAVVKFGGGIVSICGKGVEAMGRATHDGCAAMGLFTRACTSLIPPDSKTPGAFKAALSTSAKCLANSAQVLTDMLKEAGTQSKDLGNRLDVPGLSQTFRVMGGATQAIAQGAEGIVQGGRKIITGEVKEGGKVLASGIASGGKTFGSEVKQMSQEAKVGIAERQIKKLNEKIDKADDGKKQELTEKRDQKAESAKEIQGKLDAKAKETRDAARAEGKSENRALAKPKTVKIDGVGHDDRMERAKAGTTGGKSVEQHLAKREELYQADHKKRLAERPFASDKKEKKAEGKADREEVMKKWSGKGGKSSSMSL